MAILFVLALIAVLLAGILVVVSVLKKKGKKLDPRIERLLQLILEAQKARKQLVST